MIDSEQLRNEVVIPTLEFLSPTIPYSDNAVDLLIATATAESKRGEYIKQVGGGPALGIYQMEPATHDDIWSNFLRYRPEMADKVLSLRGSNHMLGVAKQLTGNLYYATAMARVHYYRVPAPLPELDLQAMGEYWKQWYNTSEGKGSVEHFVELNENLS